MPFYAKNTPRLREIALCAAEGSEAYQPGAIVSIVFAAIAVESFVNDLVDDVSWSGLGELDPALARLRELAAAVIEKHTRLLRKIQVIHVALIGKRCDRGQQPFQDLDLLLRLRNALVHSRPETLSAVDAISQAGVPTHHQPAPHPLVARLVERGIVPSPPKDVLTSLLAVLHHPRVAVWAYNTAVAVNSHLIALVPNSGWQETLSVGVAGPLLAMPPLKEA